MIKSIKLEDIPERYASIYKAKLKNEIEEFIGSNMEAGEVDLGERKPQSVAASIKTYCNRYGYPLRVLQTSNRVFVIRTDMEKDSDEEKMG